MAFEIRKVTELSTCETLKERVFFNGCVCFAWSRNDQHCFCLKLFPLKLRHLFVKKIVKNSITLQLKTNCEVRSPFCYF